MMALTWTFSVSATYSILSGHAGDGSGLRDGIFSGNASAWGAFTASAYIIADFGVEANIGSINLAPYSIFGVTYFNNASISYSTDGSSWTKLITVSGQLGVLKKYPVDINARYIKVSKPYGLFLGDLWFEERRGVDVVVEGVVSTSSVDSLTVSQRHLIGVGDISASAGLPDITVSQRHTLAVSAVTSAAALSSTPVYQRHNISVTDVNALSRVDSVSVAQTHTAQIASPVSAAFVQPVSVSQRHALNVTDVITAPAVVSNVEANNAGGIYPADITVEAFVSNVSVQQRHQLSIAGVASAASVSSVAVTETTYSSVSNISAGSAVGDVSVSQRHQLVPTDVRSGSVLTGISVSQKHRLSLDSVVAGAVVSDLQARPRLSVAVSQVVAGAVVTSMSVGQKHMIGVANLVCSHQLSDLTVTQRHHAAITDVSSQLTIGDIPISQRHKIAFGNVTASAAVSDLTVGDAKFPDVGIAWSSPRVLITGSEYSRSRGGARRTYRRQHGEKEYRFDVSVPWMTVSEWDEFTTFFERMIASGRYFRFPWKRIAGEEYLVQFTSEELEDTNPDDSPEYYSASFSAVGTLIT